MALTITKDFVLAGKATITIDNGRGEHYTFRITARDFDSAQVKWFVSLLAGPDNDNDYVYIGTLDPQRGHIWLTRASKLTADSKAYKVAAWAFKIIWNRCGREALPPGYTVHHSGRCGACGRTLTTPESVETGYGPDCADRLGIVYGRQGVLV